MHSAISDTWMGKYSDCQLQTPLVRPKSTIQDTPKRDDKHLRHFYMGVPPGNYERPCLVAAP